MSQPNQPKGFSDNSKAGVAAVVTVLVLLGLIAVGLVSGALRTSSTPTPSNPTATVNLTPHPCAPGSLGCVATKTRTPHARATATRKPAPTEVPTFPAPVASEAPTAVATVPAPVPSAQVTAPEPVPTK